LVGKKQALLKFMFHPNNFTTTEERFFFYQFWSRPAARRAYKETEKGEDELK
jgi:hypothetical protein